MLARKAVYLKESPLELVNLRVRILEEGNPKTLVRKADYPKRNLVELVNIKVIILGGEVPLEVAIHKAIRLRVKDLGRLIIKEPHLKQ